ncbi:MAG: hypothetical protein NWE93_00820 [Candidatus Bathyarchaeota archaeon]|nr:hypothetical protein [Candidatus Bathyarchaeota archaeon]
MADSYQVTSLQETLQKIKPDNFTEIIDKIVGDKDNLRVDVQAVRFRFGNVTYEVSGEVNFNVKHRNSRHWKEPTYAGAPK